MGDPYEVPDVPGRARFWPAFDAWHGLMLANRTAVQAWDFQVAGITAAQVRAAARADALDQGSAWSLNAGIPNNVPDGSEAPLIMTGHQPDLYHCGVWVKQLVMQTFAETTGAAAVDIVVDSDAFTDVGFSLPCSDDHAVKCRYVLVASEQRGCLACAPAPTGEQIREMSAAAIPDAGEFGPRLAERVERFSAVLERSAASSNSLAESLTKARRLHEGFSSRYLELPVTVMVRGSAFLVFAADLILQSQRFAEAYNEELAEYRSARGLRSSSQPFPDLLVDGSRTELPLWLLKGDRRESLSAETTEGGIVLYAGERVVAELPGGVASTREALQSAGLTIAPKALALTLYARVFASDLFIHGVGGARYDEVTDAVCRRFYGVEPPVHVTASLTMQLTAGADSPAESEIGALRARMNRLEHNPDEALADAPLDQAGRVVAESLVEKKAELVSRIALPGADKKAIGADIREVNERMRQFVEPLRESLQLQLLELEQTRAEARVVTDRGYPYFLWSPEEVVATI